MRRPLSTKGPSGDTAWLTAVATGGLALAWASQALAHNVAGQDAAFVAATTQSAVLPFVYLGAKHMVTGYDHLLFLLGVIFFLYRLKDVALYVTLFSVGHSATLLCGVLLKTDANPFLIDALIGLSVLYKAFDNLGGFRTIFGVQPEPRLAVLGFGLIHGLGLATKLQDLGLRGPGLVANMVSFNAGVEIGQLLALSIMLLAMTAWRRTSAFERQAVAANVLLMSAGVVLMGYQLSQYFLGGIPNAQS